MEEDKIKLVQYVIIPRKPKMSKGKIASQACHATFRALENQWGSKTEKLIEEWKYSGMCVIVLQCKSQQELVNIHEYLNTEKVINALVVDEGLTEIPMGTATALATGVISESEHWRFKKLGLF